MSYRILRKLGSGGMGDVYVAFQEGLDREVALKKLPKSDDELVARFRREMKLISQLDHPNIVRVFDWGEMDGQPFYTMELLAGTSLAQHAKADFERARALMEQGADALAYLHARELYHRDVKPANFVVAGGRLVLLDFGLARAKENTVLTADGAVLGTARYMSPEAVLGEAPGAPADVYALACTAHELVAGGPAFGGATFPEILARIRAPERPTLAGVAGTPAWFVELQRKALSLDPAERPTAAEYRDALRAHAAAGASASVSAHAVTPQSVPQFPGRGTGRRRAEPAPAGARAAFPWGVALGGALAGALFGALAMRAASREAPGGPVGPSPGTEAVKTASAAPSPAASIAAEDDPVRTELDRLRESLARTLRVWIPYRMVELDFEAAPPRALVVSVARWAERREWKMLRCGAQARFRGQIAGLAPDTDYAVRVQTDDGQAVLADARFRTLSAEVGAQVEPMALALRDPASAPRALWFFRQYPHDRAWEVLKDAIRMPHLANGHTRELADLATWWRHPGLAAALFERYDRLADPHERGLVLRAGVECGVEPVMQRAVRLTDEATDPTLLDACLLACLRARDGIHWNRIVGAFKQGRGGATIGAEVGRRAPEIVVPYTDRTYATDDLNERFIHDEFVEVASLATVRRLAERREQRQWRREYTDDALAAIGTPAARAELLRGLEASSGLPEYCIAALVAMQRCGPPPGREPSAELLEGTLPVSREAICYFGSWGSASAVPALRRLTRVPDGDRAELASWALGAQRDVLPPAERAGAIADVRAQVVACRDFSGLGAWALARLAGPAAVRILRAELENQQQDLRLQGLAWALVECGDRPSAPRLRSLAQDPKRAAAVRRSVGAAADRLEGREVLPPGTITLIVPASVAAVPAVRALTAGQSWDMAAVGAWTFSGGQMVSPCDPLPMPGNPAGLQLRLYAPHVPRPFGCDMARHIALRGGQLALTPLADIPRAAWVAFKRPLNGFAVVTIRP